MNMEYIKKKIIDAKEQYINQIRDKSMEYQRIVIYGAGIYGQNLYKLLKNNGVYPDFFCVTDTEYNLPEINSLPVRDFEDFDEKTLFLIGVSNPVATTIANELGNRRFSYIPIPLYWDEMLDDAFLRPTLEITAKAGCIVDCRYCPQKVFLKKYYSKKRSSRLSLEEFKQCIDKTPLETIIDFSGFVEPFLNHEAVKMMLYAAEKRDVRLYTTFVGMDLETFHHIEDIPFRRVVVHLPDVNHFANIPITDDYIELLRYVASKRKKDNTPFIDMANCQSAPHPNVAAILKNKVMISWHLINRAGNIEGDNIASQYCVKGRIYCSRSANMDHTVLLPNGDVVLCCMDYGMQHVLGNLLEQSYEDIISGSEMQVIRRSMQSGEGILCRNCTAAKIIP